MNKYIKQLKEGILDNNPTLVQLLGMCPTLATTTSLKNAVGMGLAATAVLICSNLFISLLRKFIPKQVRIAAYIVIVSGFVTAVELLMRAYFYSLYQSLGLFIPLIVVNCIILARAEAFASKNPPLPSLVDGVGMGLGFTFALCLIASVRELLGAGTLFGLQVLPDAYPEMTFFVLPAGAFVTLGFVIAAVQKIRNSAADRARLKSIEEQRYPAAPAPEQVGETETEKEVDLV
ncbi:MAG: electron transport complex subunit E [Clostridia bacterium]|nr:electron transport complex subunit E [Clostridia bacterium]